MSVTTTTTYANNILTEHLSDVALGALTPKLVTYNLVNQDSIDGLPTLAKEYRKIADDGPAAAATEGVDFTTVTTLSMDTTVTATPTEGAVARADITTRTIRRKYPGVNADAVWSSIASGDYSPLMGLLEEEVQRLSRMCLEKQEVDLQALLDDFSDSVGSSGVDLTIANLLSAIYKYEENEPQTEDCVFDLHPEQVNTMRSLLLAQAAASASAGLWVSQADGGIVNYSPDASRNGLKGSFLGIPVYQHSPSTNPLPNAGADVAGALMARGVGRPEDGQRGALVLCEGMPMRVVMSADVSARTIELMVITEYAALEHTDAHGVSIITDAP